MLQDPTTGLVDMGARSYDPTASNFTSQDTIIGDLNTPIGLNRYTYGQGSPIDHFDPDGHWGIPKFLKNAAKKVAQVFHKVTGVAKSVAGAIGGGISNAVGAVQRSARSAAETSARIAASGAKALQQATSQARKTLSAAGSGASLGFSQSVKQISGTVNLSQVHLALDVAGLVPGVGEIADGVNAGLYLLQGDTKNALISFGAMAVGVGVAATATRIAGLYADRAASVAIHADGLTAAKNAPITRKLNHAPKAGGAGGDWPTIGAKQGGAVAQTHPLSCASACGEMLGGGLQADLIAKIGAPADAKSLAGAMDGAWQGGYVGPDAMPTLMQRAPWAAQMHGGGMDHMVVVSGLDDAGNVMVRDPWGGGSTYGVAPDDFRDYWSGIAVFR